MVFFVFELREGINVWLRCYNYENFWYFYGCKKLFLRGIYGLFCFFVVLYKILDIICKDL